jgi:hypothetical protein
MAGQSANWEFVCQSGDVRGPDAAENEESADCSYVPPVLLMTDSWT